MFHTGEHQRKVVLFINKTVMVINGITFPDWLKPETVANIKAIVRRFVNEGTLDKLDSVALNAFARDLDIFLECDERLHDAESEDGMLLGLLAKSDRGNLSISPYFNIRKDMEAKMFAWMRDFGLTQASREKLKRGDTGEEDSALMQLLRENAG